MTNFFDVAFFGSGVGLIMVGWVAGIAVSVIFGIFRASQKY